LDKFCSTFVPLKTSNKKKGKLSDDEKENTSVMPFFTDTIKKIFTDFPTQSGQWCNTHKLKYLPGLDPSNNKAPDITFIKTPLKAKTVLDGVPLFIEPDSVDVSDVLVVGDAKNPRSLDTATCKGQLVNYCARILELQPLRDFIFSFLCNGKNFVFLKVFARKNREVKTKVEEFCSENWGEGLCCLASLIHDSKSYGYVETPIFEKEPLKIGKIIGWGATSTVFSACDKEMVWKKSLDAKYEYSMLSRLDSPYIPKCRLGTDFGLLLSPSCEHFEEGQFEVKHAQQLVEALRHAHSKGIVHRDIRPLNIMRNSKTDEAVLIDWGYAVEIGKSHRSEQEQMYLGTVTFASPAIYTSLKSGKQPVGNPADDLVSLVKTIYVLQHPEVKPENFKADIDALMPFWDSIIGLHTFIKAARARDYNNLSSMMQYL
jgi:hypothetical protein